MLKPFNYLATLPPKKRFYSALVCLPLMFGIIEFIGIGLRHVNDMPSTLIIGGIGAVAAWNMQRIAAAIVTLFERTAQR